MGTPSQLIIKFFFFEADDICKYLQDDSTNRNWFSYPPVSSNMARLENPSFINDFHIWPLFIGDFHGFSDCHVWLLEGKPGSQVPKAATVRLKNKNGLEAFQKPAPNIFSDLKALYIDMVHPFSSPLPCLGKLIDTNVWICVAMCWNAKSVVLGLEKNMFCYFCSMESPGDLTASSQSTSAHRQLVKDLTRSRQWVNWACYWTMKPFQHVMLKSWYQGSAVWAAGCLRCSLRY